MHSTCNILHLTGRCSVSVAKPLLPISQGSGDARARWHATFGVWPAFNGLPKRFVPPCGSAPPWRNRWGLDPVYPLISVLNNVAEGAEILGRAARGDGGGVSYEDQDWQVWWGKVGFTLADLGSGGLSGSGSFTTQAIRAALFVYASRRGGLPPSRLALLPEPPGLCRFWIGGGHHQLEGEGSVEILGAGRGREKDQRKGSKHWRCPHTRAFLGRWMGEKRASRWPILMKGICKKDWRQKQVSVCPLSSCPAFGREHVCVPRSFYEPLDWKDLQVIRPNGLERFNRINCLLTGMFHLENMPKPKLPTEWQRCHNWAGALQTPYHTENSKLNKHYIMYYVEIKVELIEFK